MALFSSGVKKLKISFKKKGKIALILVIKKIGHILQDSVTG